MPYRVLDLSRCFLTDANVKAITEALAYSTKVQVLVLREARITEQVTMQYEIVLCVRSCQCSIVHVLRHTVL
jgi:hypothetical protein